MKRINLILTWLVLLTIVGGLGASTVAFAQDTQATIPGGDLVVYFPKDTLLYASVGTSPADFEILNSYLARIEAAIPDDADSTVMMPALRIETLLDEIALEISGEDFNTSVRPWWGDEMAIGIITPDFLFDDDWYNDEMIPGMLVISITDQAAAADFVEAMLTDSYMDWERTESANSTVFKVDSYDFSGFIEVDADLLIAAPSAEYLPVNGQPQLPNLTDNMYFTDTLSLLPGSDYGAVAWMDTPMLVANVIGTMDQEEIEPAARLILNYFLRMVGPTALGLTELEGGVLAMDIAQPLGNVTGLEALGMTFDPMAAADLDFLANLPASAALVMQGTDLAQTYEASLESGQTLVDQLLGPEMVVEGLGPDALLLLNLADMVIANVSGFSYPRDLRPWLTGNYAVFAGLNADFSMNAMIEAHNFPLDFGMVFESEDGDAARNFVTMLAREVQLFLRLQGVKGVHVNSMTVNGVDMTTLDITADGMRVMQLVVAANDDLVVFGTRGAVDSVLFADSPRFDPNLPEVLANAAIILYAAPPKLEPGVAWLEDSMEPADVDMLRALLNVIERATISLESTPDGGGVMRATLRFN